MKKFLPLIMLSTMIFTACPGVRVPKHKHSIARIKERYENNITIENRSSKSISYKYAFPLTRDELSKIPFHKGYIEARNFLTDNNLFINDDKPNHFNIFGTLSANSSKTLYCGIDGGTYGIRHAMLWGYPNSNVDGLPARFVLMIDGDTNCYSLVYDCEEKNQTSSVVITDETINRLKTFKDDEFEIGYNGRRAWYGESVKIQDRLYCFEKMDIQKNSLIDYTYDASSNKDQMFYEKVVTSYHFFNNDLPDDSPLKKYVLLLYNEDDQKFYYIKTDASVNLVE